MHVSNNPYSIFQKISDEKVREINEKLSKLGKNEIVLQIS